MDAGAVKGEHRWLSPARSSRARGEAGALATVVRVQGSAYRRQGARLFADADGTHFGAISGGCLEAEVLYSVPEVVASGQPRLLRFDTTDAEDAVFGYGSGCSGIVDILVESVGSISAGLYLDTLEAVIADRQPAVMITVTSGLHLGQRAAWRGGIWHGPLVPDLPPLVRQQAEGGFDGELPGQFTFSTISGEIQAFAEILHPPLHLCIVGADEGAAVLARFAQELDWSVSVVDFRPLLLEAARFPPGTRLIESGGGELEAHLPSDAFSAVLVASRHYLYDVAALRTLLRAPPPYLGILGSAHRLNRLLTEVQLSACHLKVLHAPVGLDLGAHTPAQIALSIVSEVLATFNSRSGLPMGRVPHLHVTT
ncbi:XdhC family protein [Deinococcus sp. Arct2-2]|uniref:XdhC family protein n=1 Tax=Deinococcus sp. Arct2-2 TaxID=2568653 RepID=UPI0010A3D68D|nr:XdhC/CoxI family protein [Deinococcus sp. Arct2-2]THF69570.1 XdhC family protein [Deinococcus sp. Arct2-2]